MIITIATDYALKNKEKREILSNFLKKHSTPELFLIYGNPGEAAAAKLAGKLLSDKAGSAIAKTIVGAAVADHCLTHTGVYDSISFKVNTASGMSHDEAIKRLPVRSSVIDLFTKK